MTHYYTNDAQMGNMLWLEQGDVQIGVALDYGIRVRHLSVQGMENLYYQQPADLSDGFGTADTWKLRGGHRLWLAPECEESYCVDDEPVQCTLKEDGVIITQNTEPLLHIQKELEITFRPDNTVYLEHRFYNRNPHPIDGASWGVNSLAPGGKVTVPFRQSEGSTYAPRRVLSLWGDTNPADARIRWERDLFTAQHAPIPDYFKCGFHCADGYAVLENKGQKLTIGFAAPPLETLPDQGCNFEFYMHAKFMEMETLGAVTHMEPDAFATHWETWKLEKL